jgi:hypothetical protein
MFIDTLGPDREDTSCTLALTTSTLNYFFTQPLAMADKGWQQCACCLKVSSASITEDNIKPVLQCCNQDTNAMWLTILNATIRDFCEKATKWMGSLRAKA